MNVSGNRKGIQVQLIVLVDMLYSIIILFI